MKSTTDIWFAAYLRMKGISVHNRDVIGHGKVRCFFNVSEDDWSKLRIEYLNSDFSKFKTHVESIKDLAH